MKFIFFNLLIFYSLGSTNAKFEKILEKSRSLSVDEILVDILQRCFINEATDTIVFTGEPSPTSGVNTTYLDSLAVIRIEDPKSTWKDVDPGSVIFSNGFPVFVVAVSEEYSTEYLLSSLKKRRWWDHSGFFITLDRRMSTTTVSCTEKARESLLTIWKMDILSSIFICVYDKNNGTESISVYTFNPFAEVAPVPWTKVETRISLGGHPWTLFRQPYDSDKTTCQSIRFTNKTFDLNGYKISANVKHYPPYLTIRSGGRTIDDLGGKQARILKNVWRKLNASISFKTYDSNARFGESYENGSANGMISDLIYGKCDINLNRRYIRRQRDILFSSPQSTGQLHIVANHRGWKSPLTKITDFIKSELLLTEFLICSVSVLITGYSISHSTTPDIMNVPRLLLSTSIRHVPETISQRFLLLANMLMVLLINSAVQGKLAGLLTSRVPSEQVETMADIDKLGYGIYGFQYMTGFVPPYLLDKFIDPKLNNLGYCSEVLANNSHAACIAQTSDIPILMTDQKLYISRKKIAYFHKSHTIRKNWPLFGRFNELTERLVNGGLTRCWEADETPQFQNVNTISSQQAFRALKYSDLSFAFRILAIGLTLAGFAFIIELCIAHRRRRNRRLFALSMHSKGAKRTYTKSRIINVNVRSK